jgi:oxygen-independent coproporphyrinogen III oxidase
MDNFSLYIHIPFCKHRCSYCDFNTYAGQERKIPAYVEALCCEIASLFPVQLENVCRFIPFSSAAEHLPCCLLNKSTAFSTRLQRIFIFNPGVEITLEANPGTVSLAYLKDLRQSGINRLSFGMQSADPTDLKLLDRRHLQDEVAQAVNWARQAAFTI